MKRHKNLERAIVLGLMLSTGIYGTAFAEDYTSNGEQSSNFNITGDNATIKGTLSYDGNVDIGSSNNPENGQLTINAGVNGIATYWISEPEINILANDIKITAGSNGIATLIENGTKSGTIKIGSDSRKINSLTIESGGQGIDNKAGEIRVYGSKDSKINITSYSNQATTEELKSAINNSRREEAPNSSGIVEITGGDITISANNKANGIITNAVSTTINSNTTQIESAINGVKNISGTTTINGKDITINSSQNAVYNNGDGTITITSEGMTQGNVSTLDDHYGYDISLVGEDNNGILSDGGGTTIVEADHDTIIAGKENGILSEKGKINVTAGNNNTIGQYTDENKKVHTSEMGIKTYNGTVLVTAGNNTINGTKYGIRAEKGDSSITTEAKTGNNTINVYGFYDDKGKLDTTFGDGINVTAGSTGKIELTANNGNNEINAIDDGIYVDTGSTKKVTLIAENNIITAGNNGIDYRGLGDNDSTTADLEVTATGANIITAGVSEVLGNAVGNGNSLEVDGVKYREDLNGDGIRTENSTGTVKVEAGTYNQIDVRDTGIYINKNSKGSEIDLIANGTNGTYGNIINAQENGVQVSGTATDEDKKNIINVIANNGGNSITAKENAVYNNGTGTIKISAKNPNIEVSTLANYNDYNNVLIAGENGVKSDGTGSTIVEADNNNTIAGTVNGILSNATGTINVTAGNNNVIGQYIDEEGTHTSQTGINVSSGTVTITAGNENNIYGIQNGIYATGKNSKVTLTDKITNIGVKNDETGTNNSSYGINAENGANVNVESTNGNTIIDVGSGKAYGINVKDSANVTLTSANNFITAKTGEKSGNTATSVSADNGTVNITATAENGINQLVSNNNTTLDVKNGASVDLKANKEHGENIISSTGEKFGIGVQVDGSKINLTAATNKIESASTTAIQVQNGATAELFGSANIVRGNKEGIKLSGNSTVLLDAKNDIVSNFTENVVYGSDTGIYSLDGGNATLLSKTLNYVRGEKRGIYAWNGSTVLESDNLNYIEGDKGIASYNGIVTLRANSGANIIQADNSGIYATDYNPTEEQYNNVNLFAINNEIRANNYAIFSDGIKTIVKLDAQTNKLLAGDINTQGFGSGHAIQAASASNIDLNAIDGDNSVSGVIYAKGENTKVNLTHKISEQDESKGSNIILSSAHGTEDRTDVVAAVYAQSNGEVNIIAGKDGYNYIATDTELGAGETEQTIWAQQGGKINIEGRTFIIAENSNKNTDKIEGGVDTREEQAGNSLGIAITAGTGTITDGNGNVLEQYRAENGSLAERKDEDRSTVKITYEGDENGLNSFVKGDIVSGYGGLINIEKNSTATGGIDIQGNALAANGGKLNIDLGNGGTWIGRADDYGDAGYGADAENHQNFYNPAFSNEILEGGTVNLTMGNNSTWYVNGQSWITSIDTSGAENATIDLVEANTDKNESAHALTIYNLKGNANINMSLDGDRTVSDMLYIKNAEGEYNIALADAVTTADMYANGLNGLRFATVGDGSKVKFNAGSYDTGLFNVEYEVGTDEYDGNTENDVYNGSDFNTEKPGTDSVDDFFDYDGADPNEGVTTLAEVAGETALDEVQGTTNYKLIARKGESISDAGNTVLNMSKANYSQAVYMDTLNKRLGEARYLEGDEGLWIRMRHDKIDKDSSYEITNNMYELGYDKKYESKDKNGYHRKGVAIDYMDGDTSYDNIAGSGETNRKGIWLYDTWIGNKGHYTDYVAKWGHLENSFDLYTKTRGEKVSGEYDNDVYSLSAEWGYKDQLNNDWYIEPQVQLQYARVTGADYETSQGTQVSVDGIDSLIARAGFRLGKDFGEEKKSTFYVKADVLHEFLGEQDITAIDKTTDGKLVSIGYDNDGTWYSVGLGFTTMLSDNSYAFLDVEKLFGNDNDNSYQINGGFNWLL